MPIPPGVILSTIRITSREEGKGKGKIKKMRKGKQYPIHCNIKTGKEYQAGKNVMGRGKRK